MTDVPDDWRARKHADVFEETCRRIRLRRREEAGFTIEDLEGLLETACVNVGNDWVGKGPVQETIESATIAAYEHLLAEWRAEKNRDGALHSR